MPPSLMLTHRHRSASRARRRLAVSALLAPLSLFVAATSALAQSGQRPQPAARNADPAPRPRIAVLDFTNGTPMNGERMEPLRRALGATLAGSIARSGRADVLERSRITTLLAEQDLAKTGRLDDATAARIGKLLGVQHLLLGAFIAQPNGDLLVSTRLVDVATGDVTAGPDATGNLKATTKIIDGLSAAIVRRLRLPDAAIVEPERRGAVKDSRDIALLVDALSRACETRDAGKTASARAALEKQSPGHPALAAPCM